MVLYSLHAPHTSSDGYSVSWQQRPGCSRPITACAGPHSMPLFELIVVIRCAIWSWRLHSSLPRWNFRDATECVCCANALHGFDFLFIVHPHSRITHNNTLPVSPPMQVFAGYMLGNPCPIHRDGCASLNGEVCFSFFTPPSTADIGSNSLRQHPVCTRIVTTHTTIHTGPPSGLMVIISCVTWSWGSHISLPGTGEVCSSPPPVVPLAAPPSSTSASPYVRHTPLTCDSEYDSETCYPALGAKCSHALLVACDAPLRANISSRLPSPCSKHTFCTHLFRLMKNPLGRSNIDPPVPCRVATTLLSVTSRVCSSPSYHSQIQDSRAPPSPVSRL